MQRIILQNSVSIALCHSVALSLLLEVPGIEPPSTCSQAFYFNLPAEEVRKLKSRVDDLEKINHSFLAVNQGSPNIARDISRVDYLQGVAPSSTFPLENEESVWLMVKSRLNKEIERGEQSKRLSCCMRPDYLKGSRRVWLPKDLKTRTSGVQCSLSNTESSPVLTELCWSTECCQLTEVVHPSK